MHADAAKEVAAQTEQLVQAFTSERFLQGVLTAGQGANRPVLYSSDVVEPSDPSRSDDTGVIEAAASEAALEDARRLAEVEKRKELDAQIQLGKERAQVAVRSFLLAPRERRTDERDTQAQRLAEMEAKRAQTMQDFLSGLDLDSPVPAPRPTKPSSSKPSSSIPTASRPSIHPPPTLLSPLSERSEQPSVDELPSPFLPRVQQRSALDDILAMADSPPAQKENERVKSVQVAVQRTVAVKGRLGEKVVPAKGMGREVERKFGGEKVGSRGVGVVKRAGGGESNVF